jgi:hypothetical protein
MNNELISHLLFADDVILFGAGNVQKSQVLKDIMDLFCSTTGMETNMEKYFVRYYSLGVKI